MTTPRPLSLLFVGLLAFASSLRGQETTESDAKNFNAQAVRDLRLAMAQVERRTQKYSSDHPKEESPESPGVDTAQASSPESTTSAPVTQLPELWRQAAKSLYGLSRHLESNGVPTAYAEEISANGQLIGRLSKKFLLFDSDQRQLKAAVKDLAVKNHQAEEFKGDFATPIEVEVHTKGPDGHEVNNLAVHFRRAPDPVAKATRFDLLSSPTTRGIRAGVYYFWSATIDPTPKKSAEILFEVSGRGQKTIEIAVP